MTTNNSSRPTRPVTGAPRDPAPSHEYMDRYLANKAGAFRYPRTPDIASAASQRLAAERAQRAFKERDIVFRPRRHAALALLSALAVVIMALAIPQVRALVGSLSTGAWRIVQQEPEPANVPAVPTVTPALPWDPHLAGRTDLGTAIATMDMSVLLPTYPATLGLPDRVYYQRNSTGVMIFVWMDPDDPNTPSMALYRFPTVPGLGPKITTPPDSKVLTQTQQIANGVAVTVPLKVGASDAIWVEGQYKVDLEYLEENGATVKRPGEVIDGNALVWDAEATSYAYYMLVTSATPNEALLIANSLRPLSPQPTPYPTSLPTSPSSGLDIAGETSFYQLDRDDGFKVKVPGILAMPELIAANHLYLQTGPGMGKTVVMVWYSPGRTDDLRMVMMQGTWDDSVDSLNASVTRLVQATAVHGTPARWLEGPQYMYVNTNGNATELAARSWIKNSHTLTWQENGLKYRLETDLSVEDAVRVAESLR